MSAESYLIDGKRYSEAETLKIFANAKLENREQLAMSLISMPCEGKTILDLGCLYGLFGRELKNLFPQANIIVGDYDQENLKIAQLLNPNLKSSFKMLNAYNLNLESESIDCLLFQEVIEHLEGAANSIKEINRVLKIGGELILSTPTPYYWKDMWQSFKYEIVRKYFRKNLPISDAIYFAEHEWNRHIYCWTPSTLYTLLKINGFEYVQHAYCKSNNSVFAKILLAMFPFLSPTIVIKVKKISDAPSKIV